MRTIGGSLGAQISASIIATHLITASRLPSESGFSEAFVLSAAVLGLACIAALAIPRQRRPPARSPAAAQRQHDHVVTGRT